MGNSSRTLCAGGPLVPRNRSQQSPATPEPEVLHNVTRKLDHASSAGYLSSTVPQEQADSSEFQDEPSCQPNQVYHKPSTRRAPAADNSDPNRSDGPTTDEGSTNSALHSLASPGNHDDNLGKSSAEAHKAHPSPQRLTGNIQDLKEEVKTLKEEISRLRGVVQKEELMKSQSETLEQIQTELKHLTSKLEVKTAPPKSPKDSETHFMKVVTEQFERLNGCYDAEMEKLKTETSSKLKEAEENARKYKEECEHIRKEKDRLHTQLKEQEKALEEEKRREEESLEDSKPKIEEEKIEKHLEETNAGEYDELEMDYRGLWTSDDNILAQIEGHFEHKFHAKGFLSDIVVDSYRKSKEYVDKILAEKLEELHHLQCVLDEGRKTEMENLSRVYSSLMQVSGIKTEHVEKHALSSIHEMVKKEVKNLPRFKYAKGTLKQADLPLERVVKLTWKFVTQPCPVIVCQPVKFDPDLHREYINHWDETKNDSAQLVYVEPLVYRSYHGLILRKGCVGNSFDSVVPKKNVVS